MRLINKKKTTKIPQPKNPNKNDRINIKKMNKRQIQFFDWFGWMTTWCVIIVGLDNGLRFCHFPQRIMQHFRDN